MNASPSIAPAAAPSFADAPEAAPGPYRFSTAEYLHLSDVQFFPDHARLELWDGVIYEKMAKSRAHETTGDLFGTTLPPLLPPGWFLSHERTLELDGSHAPLPDVMILRGRPRDYADRRALPADVGLLIEVSATSVKQDFGPKLREYARGGVANYWIANVVRGAIHAFRDPVPAEGRYAASEVLEMDRSIALTLDGVMVGPIEVSLLLSLA